jgi:serine/threonine protein phosphatase PrpC
MSRPAELVVSVGQHSDRGRKEINQDFHGACLPGAAQRCAKGVAIALADGIGSSQVSQVASEDAVRGFLDDYYCSSDAWSVKKSGQRVLAATNSWLHAQTQRSPYRFDKDRGYVCTFSALVIKSRTAHLFHVGDTRICRVQGRSLEQLTEDHRTWVAAGQSYLTRALGFHAQLELDYLALPVEPGETFVLASDGVHEHVDAQFITSTLAAHAGELDAAAQAIVDEAYRRGSPDNLTVQIVRVDALPEHEMGEVQRQRAQLPLPPLLQARLSFDGYTILRELHASSRSHIYLALDEQSGRHVVLKTPSIDLQGDAAYLDRFLLEEWVARRVDSAHVLKACAGTRKRSHLYVVMEYVDGQTLGQWMIDHPKPDLQTVRGIIEQIARGLQAMHRMEMVHQDLRPENLLIDRAGTVKIIDFASTQIAGLVENAAPGDSAGVLGTVQYAAPEYFVGDGGSAASDQFSLGVIAYQMLSGRLPYGAQVARIRTRAEQQRLAYRSVIDPQREIPAWVDGALRKAVHPNPLKRYEALSEFVHDLRHPNRAFLNEARPALMQRDPLLFWKGLALLLAVAVVILLGVLRSIA